jgi:hypothetical protein
MSSGLIPSKAIQKLTEEEPNTDSLDSGTDLKCPHPKCEGKKPYTRKKNL